MWSAEAPFEDAFGHAIETDPRCQWCERSLVTRFGGMAHADCDACRDEWERLHAADKIVEMDG